MNSKALALLNVSFPHHEMMKATTLFTFGEEARAELRSRL
jgi:hypothetical protein